MTKTQQQIYTQLLIKYGVKDETEQSEVIREIMKDVLKLFIAKTFLDEF